MASGDLADRIRPDANDQFAEFFSFEQADECLRCVFKTVDNVLTKFDLARLDPFAHRGCESSIRSP